jgi:hypothetical protein
VNEVKWLLEEELFEKSIQIEFSWSDQFGRVIGISIDKFLTPTFCWIQIENFFIT